MSELKAVQVRPAGGGRARGQPRLFHQHPNLPGLQLEGRGVALQPVGGTQGHQGHLQVGAQVGVSPAGTSAVWIKQHQGKKHKKIIHCRVYVLIVFYLE